jgi:hypothetical protein
MTASIPPDINTLDRPRGRAVLCQHARLGGASAAAARPGRPPRARQEADAQGLAQPPCGDQSGLLDQVFRQRVEPQHRLRGARSLRPRGSGQQAGRRGLGAAVARHAAGTGGGAARTHRRRGAPRHSSAGTCPRRCCEGEEGTHRQINDAVSAELYVDGLNIVLSPSVHKSGHTYSWEVTGDIPEVGWPTSAAGSASAPEAKKPRPPGKGKAVVVAVERGPAHARSGEGGPRAGPPGRLPRPGHNKWSVRCPWEAEHTGPRPTPRIGHGDLQPPETMPGFRCLHSHCDHAGHPRVGRVGEDSAARHHRRPLLESAGLDPWQEPPGTPEDRSSRHRPQPSEFGKELGGLIAPKLDLFRFSRNVVEIATVRPPTRRGDPGPHALTRSRRRNWSPPSSARWKPACSSEDEAGDEVLCPRA